MPLNKRLLNPRNLTRATKRGTRFLGRKVGQTASAVEHPLPYLIGFGLLGIAGETARRGVESTPYVTDAVFGDPEMVPNAVKASIRATFLDESNRDVLNTVPQYVSGSPINSEMMAARSQMGVSGSLVFGAYNRRKGY